MGYRMAAVISGCGCSPMIPGHERPGFRRCLKPSSMRSRASNCRWRSASSCLTGSRLSAVRDLNGTDAGFTPPTLHDVVKLRPENYRAVGFSRQKGARSLRPSDQSTGLDLETISGRWVRQCLLELRGVGRWTATCALGASAHIFPGDDVGAQKRLAQGLGGRGP